jgi:hypothetical protein
MHTTLSILFSALILISSTHARVVPPQPPYPLSRRALDASSPSPSASIENKCTFSLFHKQVWNVNYIQLNTLVDHTNSITIDLAQLRPQTEHNSYAKVSAKRVFEVEGLLDNANLTIRGEDGSERLRFESGGLVWTSESKGEEAWCETGDWDNELARARFRVSQNACVRCGEEMLIRDRKGRWSVRFPV